MAISELARAVPPGVPPPDSDYAVTVLLVDDQATVGHVVRRTLGNLPNFIFITAPTRRRP